MSSPKNSSSGDSVKTPSPLGELINTELARIDASQKRALSDISTITSEVQEAQSRKPSSVSAAEEKHAKIDRKVAELESIKEEIDTLIESASFMMNYLDRLHIEMEVLSREVGNLESRSKL